MRYLVPLILMPLILLACAATAHRVAAHKFHESITLVEYNRQEQSVEITVRMFADDLESILSRRSGKSVRLGKTPDVEALTLEYLRGSFELKTGNGDLKTLEWVGMETKVDTVRAYVEVKMPGGLAGSQIRNRIFFDLFRDQINRVTIKQDREHADLVFKAGDEFKTISFQNNRRD